MHSPKGRLCAALVGVALAAVPAAAAPKKPQPARKPAAAPKATPKADLPPGVVSKGAYVDLIDHRSPERPTVFVFIKPGSVLERQFLESLRKLAGESAGVRAIHLTTGAEPIAARYDVKETPTALVMDRRGRIKARSSNPDEIRTAVMEARYVPRIDWAEEGDPRLEEAGRLLGRKPTGGILRTMTLQPEYLDFINRLSRKAHFQDGYLPRRTKELIASYVSALNKCKY